MKMHDRIAQERRKKGLSQVKVAKSLGVARQTYLDIESGKTEPRVMILIHISQILECNFNYLATGEMEAPASFADVLQKKLDEMQLILSKGE